MPKISAAAGPSDATTGLGMPTDDPETAVIETEATEAGDATPALAPQQAPVDQPAEGETTGDEAALTQAPNGLTGGWSDEPAAEDQAAEAEDPGTVGPEGETMAAGEPDPAEQAES